MKQALAVLPETPASAAAIFGHAGTGSAQLSILKRSGAEIFVFAGVPATASHVVRLAADTDWHPVFLLNDATASIGHRVEPGRY
jgi:hypothetical protein